MEKSESIKNIALALVKFHTNVGTVNKGSNNPFFKSKYAALPDILSEIHQPLLDAGLVLSQHPTGNHGLTTILIHAESGEYLQDTYEMTPTKNDPQGIGSCITYQRRYAVGAVLSLNIDEDDDGNNASGNNSTGSAEKKDEKPALPWLNKSDAPSFANVVKAMREGYKIADVRKKWSVSKATEKELEEEVNKPA